VPLEPGTRLGTYEIQSILGVGGMGEVYRALDTKLKREVAIKVLPEALSQDADRLARFQREAELLATLNHPNIGAVYGLEDSSGTPALVLELVEGPTLADRITVGALPIDEALAVARQIADALESAHERGVVHRDLKPANIKVTSEGTVKVLDFGLAKMLETSPAGSVLSMSPTLSVHATYAGVILGTAAYMSPEQARGRTVDKRSDIWAFGCVLYEMLTGARAFDGEDVTETLGAVIHKEPPLDALPPSTPATVRSVLQRCLQKDVKQRFRDIGDVRLALAGAFEAHSPASAAQTLPPPRRRSLVAIVALTALAAFSIAAIATWVVIRQTQGAPQLARFAIPPSSTHSLSPFGFDRDIAISPDGAYIVYRSQQQLVVRALDQLEARPLTSTVGGRQPFVSPDGRWVGFFASGEIKRVPITGGPALTTLRIVQALRGASWGEDDTIIFATTETATGLLSVPATGGEPKVLTKPDTAAGEADHMYPSLIPGGRAVLFTITAVSGQVENAQIAVLNLETGQRTILVRGGSQADYVATGHLVYAVSGTLRAVRFDPVRLEVLSDPVPVVEQVMTVATGAGAANFAVSRGGTLVFIPGSAQTATGPSRSLVWVTRQGREEPVNSPPRGYTSPKISPDGTRVALQIQDQELDIWVWDFARQTPTRLTFDRGPETQPVWTPDSRRIIFSSARNGPQNLYWQAADGTGTVQRLTSGPNVQVPTSVSPDGKYLLLNDVPAGADVGILDLGAQPSTRSTSGAIESATLVPTGRGAGSTPEVRPLIKTTSYNEANAEISPNGRWVAYQSNESGQLLIYVRPFPDVDSGKWQVSQGVGAKPAWARNGRELFYLDGDNKLTSVPVDTEAQTFTFGNPTTVLARAYFNPQFERPYDVSPDSRRFLMIKENTGDPSTATPASMVVVLNWFEELKRLAPAK
jgi:serine/threonine-protein kinase